MWLILEAADVYSRDAAENNSRFVSKQRPKYLTKMKGLKTTGTVLDLHVPINGRLTFLAADLFDLK